MGLFKIVMLVVFCVVFFSCASVGGPIGRTEPEAVTKKETKDKPEKAKEDKEEKKETKEEK
jgi:hypothetical protein